MAVLVYKSGDQIGEKRRWKRCWWRKRLPHPETMLPIPAKLMQRVTHRSPPSLEMVLMRMMKRKWFEMNSYLNNEMIATKRCWLVVTVVISDKKRVTIRNVVKK